MQEIKSSEVNETKAPEVENYRNIQPENGMTVAEAKDFWNKEFTAELLENTDSEFGGKYNSYEKRLGCVPADGETGKFEGERGNSKFIPSDETERGAACKEKLAEYGKDGIEYKNLEPDFSEVSEGTVKIDNMTEHRDDYYDENGELQSGNFSQADAKLAEQWNEQQRDGRTDWTDEDIYEWRHDPAHQCSWHERCDTKTMDLVPYDIHSYCKHLGGVSECKARDSVNDGGGFDE